jgi:hypothetical protein
MAVVRFADGNLAYLIDVEPESDDQGERSEAGQIPQRLHAPTMSFAPEKRVHKGRQQAI